MKPAEINKWLGLVKLSQLEREKKQPNWDLFLKYFRGTQWLEEKKENKDIIVVNLVYSQVKVEIPSIYVRNPKLFMKAIKPSAVYRARIQETVLNQDMELMDLQTQIRQIIQDTILLGTGFAKTTYFVDYDEQETQPGDRGNILALVNRFQGGPIPSVEGQPQEIGKNGPEMVRVSPYNVAFRVGAHQLADPGFIGIRSRLYVEDVKNDPYFKNTEDLQPNVILTDEVKGLMKGQYGPGVDEASAMVDCWEIWNVNKGEKFVIAEGHDKALVEPEEHPYPYDHPLDILKFTDIPDEMWGFSEVEPAIMQYDEMNVHRTITLQHARKYAARKTLIKRGTINDEDQKSDLVSSDDAIVEFDGNPQSDTYVLPDAPLPQDVYNMMSFIRDDIVETIGLTPYKRGLLQGANTATEANIAEGNSNIRDQDRVDQLSSFMKKVMRKVRLCRKEFTPGEYIVQLTDDMKAGKMWEIWSKDTFTEDAILDIEYGSTVPVNSQTKLANGGALYDRLIQNPTINPQAAAAKLLEAADEKDISAWFFPPEIIKLQLLSKLTGEQMDQKGVVPGASPGSSAPPAQGGETPAELGGNSLQPKRAEA